MPILPRGNPQSPIWVVCEPYDKDSEKGYLYSCGYGYVFDKAFSEAGIQVQPFFFSPICTGLNTQDMWPATWGFIEVYKPPIILAMGENITAMFCPETKKKLTRKKSSAGGTGVSDDESSLEKWAGSLLACPYLSYPHYIIPQLQPDKVVANWQYRFIYVNIDLGHVKEEFDFYRNNKRLQELPTYNFCLQPDFVTLMDFLNDKCTNVTYLSSDIETIRPRKDSPFRTVCSGYPYCISLAPSPKEAVSFSFWDYDSDQTIKIWRKLNELLSTKANIGQNYFTFDSHYLESLGFEVCLEKSEDTMLRHHILWPELPHKLQFLTKHYTRQPYYKDEGKNWNPKNKKQLFNYNCLDSCVTFEVFEKQEEEFNDRTYLK